MTVGHHHFDFNFPSAPTFTYNSGNDFGGGYVVHELILCITGKHLASRQAPSPFLSRRRHGMPAHTYSHPTALMTSSLSNHEAHNLPISLEF